MIYKDMPIIYEVSKDGNIYVVKFTKEEIGRFTPHGIKVLFAHVPGVIFKSNSNETVEEIKSLIIEDRVTT